MVLCYYTGERYTAVSGKYLSDLWYYATIQVNATQLYQVNTYLIYGTMLLYR
jgi:hypothetical protein